MTATDLANKNQAALLHALAGHGLKRTGEILGVHESTVSRMKGEGGEIEAFARLAAALGLKLVGSDEQTYHPEVIGALHTMAKLGFELSPEMAAIKAGK